MTPNQWADFWHYTIGVNVIPALSREKKPLISWANDPQGNWEVEPIPDQLFTEWKYDGKFDGGMAIVCGEVFRGVDQGKWLNGIDCDNKLGVDSMCPTGVDNIAGITIVEQHDNPEKCHVYFLTNRPIQSKPSFKGDGREVPQIEIKSGGKHLMYCAGSNHKDGSPIEILGIKTIKTVDPEPLEARINDVCKEYDVPYLTGSGMAQQDVQVQELKKKGFTLHEGENRSIHLLRYVASIKSLHPNYGEEVIFAMARQWNQEHCDPPYDDKKVIETAKQSFEFIEKNNVTLLPDGEIAPIFNGADKIEDASDEVQKSKKFLTVMQEEVILVYNGRIYSDMQARPVIKEKVEQLIRNCTESDRNEVINKIKARTYVDITDFDSDDNITVLENGILHWDTFKLTEHTHTNHSRIMLPVKFIPPKHQIREATIFEDIEANLKDTLFYKSMKKCFTINGKLQLDSFQTVLEVAASFMIKHGIDERHYMFLGGGENGKGVFFTFIEAMLGKDNITNNTLHGLASDKFLVAELDGKLGNLFTDLEPDELKHTGIIKAIGSNEPMTVQKKYGHPYKMRPFTKLMFSCNRFPKVYDQTEGFFRRWIIVKWERSFEGDPARDEHLKEKIVNNQGETDKIFSSLIYLAKYISKRGVFTHTNPWKSIQKEWNENADPIDYFISNFIKDSETNKPKRETYSFYKRTMFEKGEAPLGFGQFGKAFAEYYEGAMLNDHTTNNRTTWVWLNIDFNEPVQTTLEEAHE